MLEFHSVSSPFVFKFKLVRIETCMKCVHGCHVPCDDHICKYLKIEITLVGCMPLRLSGTLTIISWCDEHELNLVKCFVPARCCSLHLIYLPKLFNLRAGTEREREHLFVPESLSDLLRCGCDGILVGCEL